jgi:glucose-6-phosphate isomerase
MFYQKLINLHPQKSKNNVGSRTLDYLKNLRTELPLFQLIDQIQDIPALTPIAADSRARFKDIIILGTGGSSLGGQSLCMLANASSVRLHFHDNIDPATFTKLLVEIDPETTQVIAISKSGNTAETLMQLLVCIQHWQQKKLEIKDHFLIITEPGETAIRELATRYSCVVLDHPPAIGGRFAAFTLVGLLPALIVGLDAHKIRKGARHILDQLTQTDDPSTYAPLIGALIQKSLMDYDITQSVVMPYIDRLSVFALWYRQLWAESLGKDGKGTTPIRAVGTIDQHSQLQLYLDGPKDKFFTLITMDYPENTFMIQDHGFQHSALSIFKDKTMGQLIQAEQQATIDTLVNNNCPTRVLHLPHLDEEVLGGLMMHYVIETLAMAHLLEVNPFDQPAVEESKILTRHYLTITNTSHTK